jgi:hypothetical protein
VLIASTDIIADCKFASKSAVSLKTNIKPSDCPAVIIPSTYTPGIKGRFTISISGKSLTTSRIPETGWKSHSAKVRQRK